MKSILSIVLSTLAHKNNLNLNIIKKIPYYKKQNTTHKIILLNIVA
jgi:hypothetical protein